MLVQFLTIQSEKNQHLMLSIVFFIFIVYSLYSALYISLFTLISLVTVSALGVYFYMKKQMQNRAIIQPQVYFKSSNNKSVKRNFLWVVVPFIIYSCLTIIHFIIVKSSGASIMPLVYDYGIGGVLALGLTFYMNKNWNIGICDEGIILGSKLDSKIVTWKYIHKIHYLPKSIEIELIKDYPLDLIFVTASKDLIVFEKLLRYKVN